MLENLWNLYQWLAHGIGLIFLTLSCIAGIIVVVIFSVDWVKKKLQ